MSKTLYDKDEVEVSLLGPPSRDIRYMKVEYKNTTKKINTMTEKRFESKMKLMQEIAEKNTALLVEPLTPTQVEAIKAIISMSLIEYDAYLRAKVLRVTQED